MKIKDIISCGTPRKNSRRSRTNRILGGGVELSPIDLKEGGSLPDVGHIHISEIEPTIKQLEQELGMQFRDNLLGSAGKKKFSGDIDVAVPIEEDDIPVFIAKLNDTSMIDSVKRGGVIMTRARINNFNPELGGDRTGFVQIDFIPTDDVTWLKTYYHAPKETQSEYSGVHRNLAIATLAKHYGQKRSGKKLPDGRPMEMERFKFSSKDGLVKIQRTPAKRKDGQGYTESNNDKIIGGPWKTLDEISEILNLKSPANLDSFETVFTAMENYHDPQLVKRVAQSLAHDDTFKEDGLPSQIRKYL